MSHTLTVAYANEASTTLPSANKLYGVVDGSPALAAPATNATYTVFGTQTGFVEIGAQTNDNAVCVGSLPAPSGNGFLYDVTSLEGQQILSGNWSSIIRLNASQFRAGSGLTQAGNLTADLYVRAWIRSSAGSYTPLMVALLSAQAFNSTFTNYAPGASGISASPTFNTGDKLYIDAIANVTGNSNSGNTAQGFRLNRLTTDTSTHIGDTAAFVATPGYDVGTSSTNFNTTITDTALSTFSAEANTTANFSFSTTINDAQLSTLAADASTHANGNTTINDAQLDTFTAEATTTASSAPLPPGVQVTIAGDPVSILYNGFEIDDSISSASTVMMTVRDDSGLKHFTYRQQVIISEHDQGRLFSGFVSASEEDKQIPNDLIFSKVDVLDNTYLAVKRTYPGPDFENTFAGVVFTELLNNLTAEGVTAPYESRRETTGAQLSTGTLDNVVNANNVGDGDLELAPAGMPFIGALFDVSMPATPALKFIAECTQSGGGHLYHYQKIWSGSYTLASGDTFSYSMWISSTSPKSQMGVDLIFSDGTTLRGAATPGTDNEGLSPSPATDRTGLAVDTWYSTGSGLDPSLTGKTIVGVTLGVEGDEVGEYTAYFRNIQINKHAGGTLTIFNGTLAQNPTVQVQNAGYSNASVTVIDSYDNLFQVAGGNDTGLPAIMKNSQIGWVATTPDNTEATIETTVDNAATWQLATNHAPIASIIPGLAAATIPGIAFRRTLRITGPSPEFPPTLTGGLLAIYPSYNDPAKADVKYTEDTQANFNTGTLTNVIASSSGSLLLNGIYRTYDNADQSSQTGFGNGGPFFGILNRQLYLQTNTPGEERCRLDWVGSRQNGTWETNVQVSTNGAVGIEYRTTNWQSNSNTFAYRATVSLTSLSLDRGTNNASGSGTKTNISNVAVSLTDGDWHRLKVVVNGSNHRVFLDDVLYLNSTDSTWSAAGQCALVFVNSSAGFARVFFDSAGYAAALTGNRVSAAQSIAGAVTYGDSRIWWADTIPDTTEDLIETTIDGGTTWLTATNGGPIPGLVAGQSLTGISVQIRETLTASNATLQPSLDGLTVLVIGQINASGSRIGPVLPLTNVGRLSDSLVAWNALTTTAATLGVDIRIDGGSWTDVTSDNGEAIPGLLAQPDAWIDSFDEDTSASYTSTFDGSGNAATWTPDTAMSRLVQTSGNESSYLYNDFSAVDMYIEVIMDQSDHSGIECRRVDANNLYKVYIADSEHDNQLFLFKVVGGTYTQLDVQAIDFPENSYHAFRLSTIGDVISVSMDGEELINVTDGDITAAGQAGLTGDAGGRFYSVRIQPLGQDVSTHTVQSRFRLATTDPLISPQVTDHTLAAYGGTISKGALIPQTDYIRKYISDNMNDLASQSNYWTYIDKNRVAHFLPRTGMFAPWPASSVLRPDGTADFLIGAKITRQSDLYRNRQIITNVIDTVAVNESRQGDGVSTSWTFGNAWASAPTITINGVPATVGRKNVDTGRDFYYDIGDNTITADSSSPVYDDLQTLNFQGTGQFVTESQYDDLAGQAILAARESSSGIVEMVEDGGGISKAAGDALAKARVKQYGVFGDTLTATTLRKGLAPGQLLTVFLPEYGEHDELFLIRSIKTRLTDKGDGTQRFWYDIEAINGADVGDWTKLYERD